MIKLHVDYVGFLVKSKRGNMHILVIVATFTRYLRLYAVKTTDARETTRCLQKFILQYGGPKVIISDRETAFPADEFTDFCVKYYITHKQIPTQYL